MPDGTTTDIPPAIIPATDSFEDPNHPARWKHRRRMAYMSLISMLILTGYALSPWLPLDRLEKLDSAIDGFYFAMTTIVSAYMGLATFSGVWNKTPK